MNGQTDPPGRKELLDRADERLLLGIREVWAATDGPPDCLVDQVRLALGLVDLDAEVLQLVQTEQAAAARGVEQTRRVTFSDGDVTIMISVDQNPDGTVRVDGWLAPPGACPVELSVAAEQVRTTCDADGRFALARVPRGLARLVINQVGTRSRTVTTPTVEL
jgi:hypothetical protein